MESDPEKRRIVQLIDSSPAPELPEDLIFNILTRVPVKRLFRFKSVCKKWRNIITSDAFKNQHLQVSIQRKAYKLIIASEERNRDFKSCSIDSIYEDRLTVESESLGHPIVNDFFNDWIVGTCNGLVCLRYPMDVIYVWNPCTKEGRRLPSMGLTDGLLKRTAAFCVYGFGYDVKNDDYKVLVIACAPKLWSYETQVLVYSRKIDAWREVGQFPVCGPHEVPGRLLNGVLHWAVPCSSLGDGFSKLLCVAGFDLESESFREIPLPDEETNKLLNARLGVLGECLCIVCINNNFSLLVMKEYGVKESWTTLFGMHLLRWPTVVTPLWSSEKGELLLMFDQHMILIHPSKWTIRHPEIENFTACNGILVYIESFVSP